ncbi:MAG: hypothetical protein FJ110_18825 [Deltaproteobacteria bacterium]|nr:hypothetical protein [Deltaproteobacteria bacterium]
MNPTNPINQINQMNLRNQKDPGDLRQWFVVQTKPGNELRAETNLSNQAIEVFLPLCKAFQYSNGKMLSRVKPLFPNYLFARLDTDAHYYKVKWTRGVCKVLGSGNEPIPVSGKVVEAIKSRMGEDNLVILKDPLEKGNLVEFTSGPFKGLTGIFDKRMSDQGRVRILLSMIGADVPVQASRWLIKKVA